MAETLQQAVVAFNQAVNVKYSFLAAVVLQFYDVTISMSDEVSFIWSQRWSVGKLLYLFTRYTAVFDSIAVIFYLWYQGSVQACRTAHGIVFWSYMIGVILAEVVLCVRTYAIWEQNRIILVYLFTLQVVFIAISTVFNKQAFESITFSASPAPGIIPCITSVGNGRTSVAYSCVIASELNVLVLSLYKGLKQWRRDSSPLVHTLYRDGVMYFAVLFSISVVNVVVLSTLFHTPYNNLLTGMQRVFHSVLASHLIMNVRKAAVVGGSNNESFSHTNNTRIKFWESIRFKGGAQSGASTIGDLELDNVTRDNMEEK